MRFEFVRPHIRKNPPKQTNTKSESKQGKTQTLRSRIDLKLRKDGYVYVHDLTVHNTGDVADVMRELQKSDRERFIILSLDSNNKLLNTNLVSIGHLNSALVHPREAFKPALLSGAAKAIAVHNHPSGDPAPSDEDRRLTERLKEVGKHLGVDLMASVVIGATGRFQLIDGPEDWERTGRAVFDERKKRLSRVEVEAQSTVADDAVQLTNSRLVAEAALPFLAGGGEKLLWLALDSKNHVLTVSAINAPIDDREKVISEILRLAILSNSNAGVLVTNIPGRGPIADRGNLHGRGEVWKESHAKLQDELHQKMDAAYIKFFDYVVTDPDGSNYYSAADHEVFKALIPVVLVGRQRLNDLLKAQRWITVHPHGKDEKGIPVLIEDHADGTAHVIAGAGGKLNFLKLTQLKSPEQLAQEARERRRKKRDEKRRQNEELRRQGKLEEAESTRKEIKIKRMMREKEYINKLAPMLGLKDYEFTESDKQKLDALSPGAREIMEFRHHQRVLGQVNKTVRELKRKLVINAEEREAAGLGELPIVAGDENTISYEDLTGETARTAGLGYVPLKAKLAQERGRDKVTDEVKEAVEADNVDEARRYLRSLASSFGAFETPGAERAAQELRVLAEDGSDEEIKKEAVNAFDQGTVAFEKEVVKKERRDTMEHPEMAIEAERIIYDINHEVRLAKLEGVGGGMHREEAELKPKEIVDVLREAKRLQMAEREFNEKLSPDKRAKGDIRRAFKIDATEEAIDKSIIDDVRNKVMALRNQQFLDQIEASEENADLLNPLPQRQPENMQRFYSQGTFNEFNNFGLSLFHESILDRHVVDILGTAGSAQLLARYLNTVLDAEGVESVTRALEKYHVSTQKEKIEQALAEAQEHYDSAKEIEIGTVENPVDLIEAKEMNRRRRDEIFAAREVLGRTLGEMEAVSALIMALKSKAKGNGIEIAVGDDTDYKAVIREARAMGLQAETDYNVSHRKGESRKLYINSKGMQKLVKPVDLDEVRVTNELQAIKDGKRDNPNWLPEGIVSRPPATFDVPPPKDLDFHEHLNLHDVDDAGTVRERMQDYILGQFNNGNTIDQIRNDLGSYQFMLQNGVGEGNVEKYFAAVDELLPEIIPGNYAAKKTRGLLDADGKPKNEAEFKAAWRAATKEAVEKNKALGEELKKRLIGQSGKYAKAYAERTGAAIPALNDQEIDTTSKDTQEAVFRALAADPKATFAFKPVGELRQADRNILRDHFWTNFAKQSKAEYQNTTATGRNPQADWSKYTADNGGATGVYSAIQKHMQDNPIGGGLFGAEVHPLVRIDLNNTEQLIDTIGSNKTLLREGLSNPAQKAEIQRELREQAEKAMRDYYYEKIAGYHPDEIATYYQKAADLQGNAWDSYIKMMGGQEAAYEALQDDIRGGFIDNFAESYAGITKKQLKTAAVGVSGREKHLKGVLSPEELKDALAAEQAAQASAQAKVRTRRGGKFAYEGGRGSVADKAQQFREAMKHTGQRELFAGQQAKDQRGMRSTIGLRAEQQLAAMIPNLAKNMNPKEPIGLFPGLSMSGKYINQQRTAKAIVAGKRVGAFLGVGSGKSLISIAAFADLHSKGKVKRAMFAVPSVVQEQFGGEMNRFTEPGRYQIFARPGASREERLEAYRNPDNNISVITHQALRDDVVHLLEKNGVPVDKFNSMSREQRAAATKEALTKEGIDPQMLVVDEGHDALNRKGKDDSTLAHVLDSISDNTEYYVPMTANPMKNDLSEIYDWLSKMDGEKYPLNDRQLWLNKYSTNSVSAREALQREVSRYFFSAKIKSGNKADHREEAIKLTPEQKKAYKQVHEYFNRVRQARAEGRVDVEAIKALSPNSFAGVPEDQHEKLAERLSQSAGIIKESALGRVVNTYKSDQNAKIKRVLDLANGYKNEGKPGVIFAHNLDSVKMISDQLKAAGHRVGTITGALSSADKAKVRKQFHPETGDPKIDVIVVSDAGAVGMNLQRGQWLINYDTPDTSKTHEQRNGRIDRIGQKNDVVIHDLVSDTEHEATKRKRLKHKYALGEVFQSSTEKLDDTGLAHFLAQEEAMKVGKGRPMPGMAAA